MSLQKVFPMRIFAPNYTQIPNDILDRWMPHLGEAELKVLFAIMRKTLGWHKVRDRISISQLSEMTGLLRETIISATKSLQSKGAIIKEVVGEKGKQETYYELVIEEDSNNSYQSVQPTPLVGFDLLGSTDSQKKASYTKETATKETAKVRVPTAAAFSKTISVKKQQAVKPRIYSCLLDLNLDETDMIQITSRHSEQDVKEAVFLALSKKTPPQNLAAFIEWAAANRIKRPPAIQDTSEANKSHAVALECEIEAPAGFRLEVLSKGVEIVFTTSQKEPLFVKYSDAGFKIQLENHLKKFGFKQKRSKMSA